MTNSSYLLVTRARDEERFLPGLFESVEKQTVKPVLWVIVDHASKDNSRSILDEFANDKPWVKIVSAPGDEISGFYSHARPMKIGFNSAIEYAEKEQIQYDHLGIQDADIVPQPDYYEKLLERLGTDPQTGIIGGRLNIPSKDGEKPEDSGSIVRGGSRLYRKRCFEDIGGEMPESAIWDTETDIMAQLRGWESHVVRDATALHKRATATRKGIIRGYWRRGRGYYFANYHPVSVFLISVFYSFRPPFFTGLVFLVSYIVISIKRDEKSRNPEIRQYCWDSYARFRNRQWKRFCHLFSKR